MKTPNITQRKRLIIKRKIILIYILIFTRQISIYRVHYSTMQKKNTVAGRRQVLF